MRFSRILYAHFDSYTFRAGFAGDRPLAMEQGKGQPGRLVEDTVSWASAGTVVAGSRLTYHVFGDETHTETTGQGAYRLQGAIWVQTSGMTVVREVLNTVRTNYRACGGEVKWSTLRGNRLRDRVAGMIDAFFVGPAAPFIHFNCIAVRKTDDSAFGMDAWTRDLAVYKTYYLLFAHRLAPGSDNLILLDRRPFNRTGKETELLLCLNRTGFKHNPSYYVTRCRSIDSKCDELMQLTDLLCGAVCWDWNGQQSGSAAKRAAHARILYHLRRRSLAYSTGRSERKFGVWEYRPRRESAA